MRSKVGEVAIAIGPVLTGRSASIWVSDQLLKSTFDRFVTATCCADAKRYGSNTPGPLESRRRLAGRRLNVSTTGNDTYANQAPPPPPPCGPSHIPDQGWLSRLWPKPSHPEWRYQPPDITSHQQRQPKDNLPQWLTDFPPQDEVPTAALNSSNDLKPPPASGLSRDDDNIVENIDVFEQEEESQVKNPLQLYEYNAITERNAEAIAHSVRHWQRELEDISYHVREARRNLVDFAQTRVLYALRDPGRHGSFSLTEWDRTINEVMEEMRFLKRPDKETIRLKMYDTLWKVVVLASNRNIAGDSGLELWQGLLQRVTTMQPSTMSINLLADLMTRSERSPSTSLPPSMTSQVVMHHLCYYNGQSLPEASPLEESLHKIGAQGRFKLLLQTTKHFQINISVYEYRHGKAQAAHMMKKWFTLTQRLLTNNRPLETETWRLMALTHEPGDMLDDLSELSDESLLHILRDVWIPLWRHGFTQGRRSPNRPKSHNGSHTQHQDLNDRQVALASSESEGLYEKSMLVPRFQHLAPYFELIEQNKHDEESSQKCVTIILERFLQEQRPEDFAYMAYKLHNLRAFRMGIPPQLLSRWFESYSAEYPKASGQLAKLNAPPDYPRVDLYADLVCSPEIPYRSLDYFAWRELSRDRSAWLRSNDLDPERCIHQRYMSPELAKIFHLFVVLCAREKRFEPAVKFQRIYRLYRHMKLRDVRIHGAVERLMTITGVVLPLLNGDTVPSKRIDFVSRLRRPGKSRSPQVNHLYQLSLLHPSVRAQQVRSWADETYGLSWSKWVGIEDLGAEVASADLKLSP